MELSSEAIKMMITKGRISAVTLDACIFKRNGNQFEHGLLARLSQFNVESLKFVLSDVIRGEVLKHVTEEAVKAKSRVESALKDIGKAWQVSDDKNSEVMAILFQAETPENLAHRRFDEFSRLTALHIVDSDGHVGISQVLNAYFSSTPPFGTFVAKKHEFPDAIALYALESWAKKQDTILLAVSQDSDWQEFGKSSGNLVIVDDLALALSYFHQSSDVACARLAARMKNGELPLGDVLRDAVQGVLDRSVIVPKIGSEHLSDAVISKLRLISVVLDEAAHRGGPFRAIDRPSERVMVVEAKVDAQIEVSAELIINIPNPTDQTKVPIGSAHVKTVVTQNFRILLTFDGDFEKDAELKGVEVGVQRGEVLMHVDFGDVHLDQ